MRKLLVVIAAMVMVACVTVLPTEPDPNIVCSLQIGVDIAEGDTAYIHGGSLYLSPPDSLLTPVDTILGPITIWIGDPVRSTDPACVDDSVIVVDSL